MESQKGYSNFSQHSFSTSSQKRQQKAGSVNSVDGSISSLSIYTDDDSSDDDSMLLSGLRRIGAHPQIYVQSSNTIVVLEARPHEATVARRVQIQVWTIV